MSKPQFPHDMELNRLKARRRFLKRSIRRAKLRLIRFKLQRRPAKRLGRVRAFITMRRKQLGPIEFEIGRRRRTLRDRLRRNQSGFVNVNGRPVCAWIARELETARKHGWRGQVVSGYRTPAYSEHLCYGLCGRPSCPGRCAGRNTNHARGPAYPLGAVDVTQYRELQQICVKHGLRIHNSLPGSDPVHFSSSGR